METFNCMLIGGSGCGNIIVVEPDRYYYNVYQTSLMPMFQTTFPYEPIIDMEQYSRRSLAIDGLITMGYFVLQELTDYQAITIIHLKKYATNPRPPF